jgi:hypothetical protein
MARNERIYVTENDTITIYENNLVKLTLSDGREFTGLEPRRLFPVNNPDNYISLIDAEGREVALIRSVAALNPASFSCVKASLDDYYLVPRIIRIVSASEKYGTVRWVVETDRGIKGFDIRNRNHDIRVYKDGRIRVRDSDDNRYIISDYHELDQYSKNQLISDL